MSELQSTILDGQERFITPVDETGLPFCFAATVDLPPPRTPQPVPGEESRVADLNHMFPKYEVATSDSPALETDKARAALTASRVQWVDYWQHHGIYNNQFVGPEHPQTDAELFRTLAMASAGYIPEHAIDLSGDEPKVVGVSLEQRKELWVSGQVDVYNQADVSKFLFEYVFAAEVDHINQSDVEEFLYTFNYARRLHLGHQLVAKIIDRVIAPVEEPYRQARKQDVFTVVRLGGRVQRTPGNPRDLVKAKLRVGKGFGMVQNALMMRLAELPHRSYREYVDAQAA